MPQPAAEPIHEQVIAAILADLQSIAAGATYWHDTEKAIPDPHFHGGHMDKGLSAAKASYVVAHDQDEDASDTFTDYDTRMELDIIAFRKFEPASEEPYNASVPKRGTVQAHLAADVKNRLRADQRLAAVAALQTTHVSIAFTHFAADATLYKGWAVVMLRVVVTGAHAELGA
jgi:hypothetical protein